jgi:hypothetical protein
MAVPASSMIIRVAYGVTQLPRVAWYLGQGLALRRLADAARRIKAAASTHDPKRISSPPRTQVRPLAGLLRRPAIINKIAVGVKRVEIAVILLIRPVMICGRPALSAA